MADPNIPPDMIMVSRKEIADLLDKALGRSGKGFDNSGLTNAVNGLTNSFNTNSSALGKLTSFAGIFGDSNSAIGKVVSGLTAAGAAIAAVGEQAKQNADAIFQMYNTGVVMNMDMLSDTANAFGLTVTDLTKLITRYGQTVSVMGIQRARDLGAGFLGITNNGARLGLTIDQANDTLMSYSSMLARTGRLQGMTNDQLINGAARFAEQLNAAAQASGKNVDQIRQEVTARMQQDDVVYQSIFLSEQQQEELRASVIALNKYNNEFSNIGSTLVSAKAEYMQSGSLATVTNQALIDALVATGTVDLFEQMMRAPVEQQDEYMRQIEQQMETAAQQNLGKTFAASNPEAANIISQFIKGVEPARAAMAEGSKALDTTAVDIQNTFNEFNKAGNQLTNAVGDLATALMQTAKPIIDAGVAAAASGADIVSRKAQELQQNPMDLDTLIAALTGAGVIAMADLSALGFGAAAAVAGGGGTGAASAGAASMAAQESMFMRLLKAFGFVAAGQIADQVGDTVQSTGYTQTGAAISALGETMFNVIAAAKLAPGVAKIPAALAAGGYSIYDQFDNITTLTNPPAAESVTETPSASVPVNPELTPEQMDAASEQTQMILTPLTTMAENSINQLQQNRDMITALNSMITKLTDLSTKIEDQTTELRRTMEESSPNVYP